MNTPKMIGCAVAWMLFFLGSSTSPAIAAFATLLAVDATQPFTDPEDNLEIVLRGDQRANLPGQYVNPFGAPNSVNVLFDAVANVTIVSFAGQPIPSDKPAVHTLGLGINAQSFVAGGINVNPDVVDGYWTMGPTIEGHLPQPNISVTYLPVFQSATVTISNDPDTFSLFSVGYQVTNAPFAFSSLNRTTLPPGSFVSSGVPDGTSLAPGGSVSFTITGITPDQYVTVFADAQYSGTSSGNPYQDLSGHWFEAQAVPEPGSLALVLTGVVALGGRAHARRRRQERAN
jgi:hypothetical protein